MFNLLIVDDEDIMLDYLAASLEWDRFDISKPFCAYNGKQALEIIKSEKIHIVITDIKMPVMNGIELMKQALEYDPEIKFIILSGYDDYDYLRTAYKLGAVDYFLKSIMSVEQLQTTVYDITTSLKAKTRNLDINSIRNPVNSARHQAVNNILCDCLGGIVPSPQKLDELNIFFSAEKCRVLVIKLFSDKQYMKNEWDNNPDLLGYALLNILTEVLQTLDHHEICLYADDTVVLFLPEATQVEEIYSLISSIFCTYLGINSTAGVYPHPVSAEGVNEAYIFAGKLLNQYFFTGKNILITQSCISDETPSEFSITSKISILRNSLNGYNASGIFQTLENLTLDVKNYDISRVRKLFDQYAYELEYFCDKNDIYKESEPLFSYYSDVLREYGDLNELNQWLKKILFEIVENMQKSAEISILVKNYIEEHYTEDISLDLLEKTFLTSRWLISRAFHKSFGTTIVKYITTYRIQKATELLIYSDLSVNQIATTVGYSNIEHFSRSFKKITGTSPKLFRKEHSDKE